MTNLNKQVVNVEEGKGVYIPSIEASDIWESMNRDKNIHFKYLGYIPNSLELLKLNEQKEFKTFESNRNPNKLLSRDIINVKFTQKVKSAEELKELYNKKISEVKQSLKQIKSVYKANKSKWTAKLKLHQIDKFKSTYNYKRDLEKRLSNINDNWSCVKLKNLRDELYKDGFTLKRIDKKTDEVTTDVYKMYKRSGSKSRKGECLFIKEILYDEMTTWSRMKLRFIEDELTDLASLSAYQALVTSSIEKTISIDPNSILVVEEVFSKWNEKVNVIKTVEEVIKDKKIEKLVSEESDNHPIENSIFDGEGLLDSEFFEDNQSMMLLRQHFTKVATFSTNLQLFFEDYAKEHGIEYDTWTVNNMWGQPMNVKDIKMILNPSCIKFLKFSYLFKQEGENIEDHEQIWQARIWEHWKGIVSNENNIWGVCKHDKPNARGIVDEKPLQRLSYQMLNSMEAKYEEIEGLAQFEVEYIDKLKNNPDKFIEHISNNIDDEKVDTFSPDKMFVDLYEHNKNIIHTEVFKKFRADTIYNYVKEVKRGHLHLHGDYCTLFSCPVQYLYHSIGKLNDDLTIDDVKVLEGNEIYTTLFGEDRWGDEYTVFRNPHTSASNIWISKNTFSKEIKTYFNLSPNVIVINTIKENVLNRLSGADMDSDAVAVFDNEKLLSLGKKCYGKYNVCVNELEADKTEYRLNMSDLAKLDYTLARSTVEIGSIVNLGQLCNSLYFNYINNGKKETDELVIDIFKQTDILTILSGCSIDNAKRSYKINIGKELRKIQQYVYDLVIERFDGKYKPNFFQYFDKNEETKFIHYDTPMDYLYDIMTELKEANAIKTNSFSSVLIKTDIDGANRKQRQKVKDLVAELYEEQKSIHSKQYKKKEKNAQLSNTTNVYLKKIGKLKIKPETMYGILKQIDEEAKSIRVKLLNCLYNAHKETFLNCFKKSHG